jgi:uncharacterized RDD family membrane protein YckC
MTYQPPNPQGYPPQGQQPGYPPQGQPGYPPGYPPQGQPGYPPQYGYQPPAPAQPAIASMGRRIGALIIDGILISIAAGIVAVALNLPGVQQTTDVNGTTTFSMVNSGWSSVLGAVFSLVYAVGSWVSMGGTPGQRLLGMHVYRASGPQLLTIDAAVIRWALLFGVSYAIGAISVAAPSSASIVGLGQLVWLVVLIVTTSQSPLKQGIHDRYARSVVVKG